MNQAENTVTKPPADSKRPDEKRPAGSVPSSGPKARRKRVGWSKLARPDPSDEARRVAAVILEVLGGARTPTQAAETLGVSVPRYYVLESRALEGFLKGCERRAKGPPRIPEREIGRLEREVKRLERQCARGLALLRAQQRAAGIAPPKPVESEKAEAGRKRRRRRPMARALRAAKVILKVSEPEVGLEGEVRKEEDLRSA